MKRFSQFNQDHMLHIVLRVDGKLKLDKPLAKEHLIYLQTFAKIKHIARDVEALGKVKDPIRKAVKLPLGEDGEYFVASGKTLTKSIIDYDSYPKTQPSLWCCWKPDETGKFLIPEMDDCDFADAWLKYIVSNFIIPWGYSLSGRVKLITSPIENKTNIVVNNNEVEVIKFDAFA